MGTLLSTPAGVALVAPTKGWWPQQEPASPCPLTCPALGQRAGSVLRAGLAFPCRAGKLCTTSRQPGKPAAAWHVCALPRGDECVPKPLRCTGGSGSAAAASRRRMSLCARGAAAAALGMRRVRETAGQGENGFEVLRAWLQPCFEGDQTQPHTWPGRGFTIAQLGSRSTAAAERT